MTREYKRDQQHANAQGLTMKEEMTVALDSLKRALTRLRNA
jgi:hypothetical protein